VVEALNQLGQQVATFRLDDRLSFYQLALLETGRKGPNGEVELRKALTNEQAIGLATNGLLADCYRLVPDVLIAISAFFLPAPMLDLIRARGSKIVLWHTEQPYQQDEQLERAAHADLNILNDPIGLEHYEALTPSYYQPHCYRPSLHRPGPPDPALVSDFAFVGTGFASRIAFLEAMDLDGLDVLLAGQWQQLVEDSPLRKWLAHDIDRCLDNTETAQVYRSARTSLNLYRREADRPELAQGWAMGPREVELAACSAWFTRDPRPEGDDLFPMLPTCTDPAEASEQVRWALAHPDQRQRAAVQAHQAVADRTFTNAAKRLLHHLDQ
jgi:spore maturation protein CgeB